MSDNCTDEYCPDRHESDVSCYQMWRQDGHDHGYFDKIKLSREELAETLNRHHSDGEVADQSWRTVGLETYLFDDDEDLDFGRWVRRGREKLWLIYRQKPEVYAEVPDESGGKMLELLFSVTQANWENVRASLDEANLRLICVLAIRLVENALLVDGEEPDVEGRAAAPLAALSRVSKELERRRAQNPKVGQNAEEEAK